MIRYESLTRRVGCCTLPRITALNWRLQSRTSRRQQLSHLKSHWLPVVAKRGKPPGIPAGFALASQSHACEGSYTTSLLTYEDGLISNKSFLKFRICRNIGAGAQALKPLPHRLKNGLAWKPVLA